MYCVRHSLLLAILGMVQTEAQAALPADAILAFDPGITSCTQGAGTPPDNCSYGTKVATGSYFAMDTNGDGTFTGNEKLAIERSEGVRISDIQPA